MSAKIETVIGKTRTEAELIAKDKFKNKYQIIYEQVKREKWLFWKTFYELKVLIQPEESVKSVEEKKEMKKASEDKDKDDKKEAILKMLREPETAGHASHGKNEVLREVAKREEDSDSTINELKQMVQLLMKKVEESGMGNNKQLPLPLVKMESYLREQEVDSRTARIYVEEIEEKFKNVAVIEEEEVNESIRRLIENQINVMGPVKTEETKIIALVGPTGVGKTTTLAKIGWELHKQDRTVGFITTDTFRSGAKEQLTLYAQSMDSECMVANGAKELKEAIQYFQNVNKVDHILVDTVGRNPMLSESVDSVKEYLEISQPTLTCLVLSSTSKVMDLKEILNRFDKVKIDSLILTKLDETYNVGSLLNIFNFTKVPLLYITDGQDITKDIYAPNKRMISEKILNKETKLEGKILA